ncbi:MAG: exosortase system-associated protein, TIGR04073 family [Candidatus Omnitrophica bacterium]|nr:exosortase system-associated protein, TIGR04073 family [Candidatus Omnitrophota bacterium]
MKNFKTLVVAAALALVGAQTSFAARTSAHAAAESPEYSRKTAGMLGRGLINVTTCFVDLLVNIANETKNGPPLVGTLVGVGKGAGCTVLRALSGGVDIVTFWVPGFNGIPVSDSYDNCVSGTSAGQAATWSAPSEDLATSAPAWQEPAPDSSSLTVPAAEAAKAEQPRYSK